MIHIILAIIVAAAAKHSVSAWTTTSYNAIMKKSSINWRSSYRRQVVVDGDSNHGQTIMYRRSKLQALPEDDIVDDNGDDDTPERRRKRDILKRTLGLSSGSGSENNSSNSRDGVKKLNTDNLFKGMPPINSILGGPSSPLPDVGMIMPPDDTTTTKTEDESTTTTTKFEKQGQLQKELDLLTPDEKAQLDGKYNIIREQSERLIEEELAKGKDGELGIDESLNTAKKKKSMDSEDISDDASSDEDGDKLLDITNEEAKRIVDYAVEEDKLAEKRMLNEQKKQELIQTWENESLMAEQSIEDQFRSSSTNNNNDEIINNDAIAREIISNDNERDLLEETKQKQLNDLNFYSRQLQQRKDVEGVVTKATESFYQEDGSIMDVDIDAVYEKTLSQIQSSRKDRLGPKSFGVLSNSIALEEGREYVMKQKEQKDFLASVEREAGLVDASDEDVTMFFKPPVNLVEERMYRSIVRQIVDKREEEEEEVNALESDEALDPAEEGWEGGGSSSFDNNKKMKYQLTPKETVEAYKLLNLWRTIQKQQDEMEIALGMKDDVNEISNRRPLNKLEPYFLYEEDTEEKRQKEKENLTKILQKGLASEDDVEKSSNELLMKELLEGGVTKDRAVRLLDKLMNKVGLDDTIRESLEELRVTLLEEDDSDGGWTAEAEEDRQTSALLRKRKSGGPIDLSGVFRTSDMDEDEVEESTSSSSPSLFYNEPPPESLRGVERTVASWGGTEEEEKKQEEDTSSSYEPPPPNTPFFQDVGAEGGEAASSRREDTSPAGGMFGTYEEQRLKKLANKVGAETEEEMDELRRNMEALREAEEMADAKLSDDDFDIEAASSKLGIDVNSLNLDDDNDDQIMSILGKRPGSSSSSSSSSASTADSPPSTSYPPKEALLELNEDDQMIKEDIIVDAAGHLKRMKEKKETDIVDDIFRAKTAGRQYQDRETRNADEAAFRDFMKMEEDAIEAVDSISDDDETMAEDLDLDEYAEDIMSEIKPRPSRPKREDFMSREDLQKERRKESLFGDDPFPINESQQSAPSSSSSSSSDGSMPEWFRKEQEELGINVDDMNDSEFDEARREWEREERQRKADEYLKERGEGISISDVLGREYFGPMDEPDYEEARDVFDSFLARKDLLLGYTELTVEDINNVVDFKVDPLATGYNKYLSKVQRPFSEYGSIFRLEGVLVDMIGMHAKAWKQVSDKHGYTLQSRDEIRQASLYKPEDAVREVFRWTDDIYELQDIAQTHQDAFQEAFNAWLQTGGHVLPASDEQSSVGGTDSPSTGSNAMPSNEEMDSMYYLAWSKLANNMDKQAPTTDEVNRGIMGGDWEVAVKDIFGWSDDATEIYDIVVAYDEILQADYRILLNKYGINLDKINAQEEESLFGLDFPDLELHGEVFEFLDILQEVDMPVAIVSHLPRGDLDVVLNATGLADYFPVDKRVSLDDSYQSERSELLGAALRLEQRPDQCIVFDNTPLSADVAHGVDMKSVSFVNHYARYELLTADLSVGYVADLELSSLVKLFDKREDLEPLLELDVDSGMQKYQRKAKTAFWDE